ncbi:MAG: prohibitin family protein [Acidobacteriales bacterium]|nr:prohibitin family protein [Terriglobales bacterium]
MTDYSFPRGRVIDAGGGAVIRGAAALIALVLIAILVFASLTQIDAGHVGVLTLFGKVQPDVLDSGIHFVNPFAVKHQLSVRTVELKETASVPSSEGLMMGLEASLLFKVNHDKAVSVYKDLGERYITNILEPTFRSAMREATASHTAAVLYSGERNKVAQEIFVQVEKEMAARGIIIERVLLRDIQLPPTLRAAIEAKQQAEQESLAMSFRLQKEKQEADRKRIEAEGIRDFQKTVAQGINQQLLTWKGIEATEKLADSKNTKVVVIGSGKEGLPLILGQ